MADPSPVLKWAGGKRALWPQISPLLPERIEHYYEPFFGGGAVFWALAAEGRIGKAYLSDANPELINLYQCVQDDPEWVMMEVDEICWCPVAGERYYELREWRNELWDDDNDPVPFDAFTAAALTLILNKYGFNGLYRLNRKGEFNVSWGKREVVSVYDADTMRACSRALQGVSLECCGFSEALSEVEQWADQRATIYLDPPYVPISPTASFASYTADGFNEARHAALAGIARHWADRGVRVVASNSDTPLVRELYDWAELIEVEAPRSIGGKAKARELLIVGGEL